MDLGALQDSYWEAQDVLRRQEQGIRQRMAALEEQIAEVRGRQVDWFQGLVHPIRDALAKRFPDGNVEALGPFGIGRNVSIDATRDGEAMGHLALRLVKQEGAYRLHLVDTEVNTGAYAPGTIGDVNGLNHPTHALPRDLATLVALFVSESR